MLVGELNETLTEEGGADGAVRERGSHNVIQRKQDTLTISHCVGCFAGHPSPSSSQTGSDSDSILSSFLQTS